MLWEGPRHLFRFYLIISTEEFIIQTAAGASGLFFDDY